MFQVELDGCRRRTVSLTVAGIAAPARAAGDERFADLRDLMELRSAS